MIIAASIIFSALLTLAFIGLSDCFDPIKRYMDDRFKNSVKPSQTMAIKSTNENTAYDEDYKFA